MSTVPAGRTRPIAVARGAANTSLIEGAGFVVVCQPTLSGLASSAPEAEALVVRSGEMLDANLLSRFPHLRLVVRPGSGLDNIDVAALRDRRVNLVRNPDANAPAVGEWVLAACFGLTRRLPLGHNGIMIDGSHLKSRSVGRRLADLRVAIWGAGPVGRAAEGALRGHVRDTAFVAWPSVPPGRPQRRADELCDWADIHIDALPARPANDEVFDREWLSAVGARRPHLVVAGRLSTVKLPDLIDGLATESLSGLAIDPVDASDVVALRRVVARHPPLNLLVTPHVGAQREDVRDSLNAWVVDILRRELS